MRRDTAQIASIRRGAYVLSEAEDGSPQIVLVGTGSELSLALEAQAALGQEGIPARVVSMPCSSRFDRQSPDYRQQVLPAGVPVLAIEAGHPDLWWKYVGSSGAVVGIDRFGESAPAGDVYKFLGVDVDHLVAAVKGVA